MAALRLLSIGLLIVFALLIGTMLTLAPRSVSRPATRFVHMRFCRLACRSLGIRVDHAGSLPSDRPILLIANHISWTDVLALGSLSPMIFLARHDLAHWPLLGKLARAYGTLFVEGGGGGDKSRRSTGKWPRKWRNPRSSSCFPRPRRAMGRDSRNFTAHILLLPVRFLKNSPTLTSFLSPLSPSPTHGAAACLSGEPAVRLSPGTAIPNSRRI